MASIRTHIHDIVASMAAYATTETPGFNTFAPSSMMPSERCRPQRLSAGLSSADPAFKYSGIGGSYNSGFSELIAAVSLQKLHQPHSLCRLGLLSMANMCALRVCSVLRWTGCLRFEWIYNLHLRLDMSDKRISTGAEE